MGKFIVGLVIGVVAGIAAMTVNPDLPHDLRVAIAERTAALMRTAGETAEELGDAAEEVAEEVGHAVENKISEDNGAPLVVKEIPSAPEPEVGTQ